MNDTGQQARKLSGKAGTMLRLLQRLARWSSSALGILWALPLTMVGLLLALPVLFWKGQLRLVLSRTPAILVSGPAADLLLHHHPFGPMCAMAIGHIVISEKRGLTPQILIHELAHVRQAAQWGILFPVVYLCASLWAVLNGRDAYWHNAFEVAARKAEKHA